MQYYDAEAGRWISNRRMILRNYFLSGFFVVDIVSCFPFDMVSTIHDHHNPDDSVRCGNPRRARAMSCRACLCLAPRENSRLSPSAAQGSMGVLRILRLLKLLRLVRIGRVVRRIQDHHDVNYSAHGPTPTAHHVWWCVRDHQPPLTPPNTLLRLPQACEIPSWDGAARPLDGLHLPFGERR